MIFYKNSSFSYWKSCIYQIWFVGFSPVFESYIYDIPLSREDGLGKVYMFLRECDISMVFKQLF